MSDQVKTTTPTATPNAMLRAWREHMGYSVEEAVRELGCRRDRYNDWELQRRVPRYISLACAALALGMRPYGEADEKKE